MEKESYVSSSMNYVNIFKDQKLASNESFQKCPSECQSSSSNLRRPYYPVECALYPAAEYDDGHFNKENEFATVNQIKRHTEIPPYETSEKCMFNNSLSISNVEESYRKPLERKDGNIIDPELDPKNIQLVQHIPFKLKVPNFTSESSSIEDEIENQYEPVVRTVENNENFNLNTYQLKPISVNIKPKRTKSKQAKPESENNKFSHIKSKVAKALKPKLISKSEVRRLEK